MWLSTRDLRLRLPCKKLSPCYIGPFKIQRQINEVTYQLQLPPGTEFTPRSTFPCSNHALLSLQINTSRTSLLLQRFWTSRQSTRSATSWTRGDRLEYFIKWEGYGPEEQSWVARDDILDPMLCNDPDRPAPRGRGRPCHRMRVSGAAPGGGGNVRESQSLSPPSSAITRSQSPEF